MKGAYPAASSQPPIRPLRLAALLAGTAVLGLSGCASNLSGVGGTPTYACNAPADDEGSLVHIQVEFLQRLKPGSPGN